MSWINQDVGEQIRSIRASLRLLEQVARPTSVASRTLSEVLRHNVARLDRVLHSMNLEANRSGPTALRFG
jgi:hypothetical protein